MLTKKQLIKLVLMWLVGLSMWFFFLPLALYLGNGISLKEFALISLGSSSLIWLGIPLLFYATDSIKKG